MDGGGAGDQATDYLAKVLGDVERLLGDGDADAAVALLEESLLQARNALAYGPQGLLHAALGDVHRQRQEHEAALGQYDQAAAALHEAGDTAAEAGALLRAGDAHRALKRSGAATQRYAGAAALYALLDDPRGAAHGEFLLAELASGVHADIAERHYQQAIELYREAAERQGGGAAESAPPLPDPVTDPRAVASWQMVEVAQRACERLQSAPPRASAPPVGDWVPPAAPPAREAPPPSGLSPSDPAPAAAVASPFAALWLAAIGLGLVGVLLVAMPWGDAALLGGLAAMATAAGLALLEVRRTGAVSQGVGYAAAGLAWLLLLASGARSLLRPSAPPSTAAVPALERAVTPTAEPEPWTPAGQRATFERSLAAAAAGEARAHADLLRRFGDFEYAQGERRRSLALWTQGLDRYRAAGAPAAAAELARPIGDLHRRSGRPPPARAQFAAAAALYGEARDGAEVAGALRRRGNAEAAMGRWDAAAADYGEALRLARAKRSAAEEILLVLDIAAMEQARGRAKSARALLYRALRLSEGGNPLHARVWLALADFEAAQQVDAAAQRAYDRAVSLAGAERNAALEARGMRHWARYEHRRGLLTAARNRCEVAMRLADSREAHGAEALSRLEAAALEVELGDRLAARALYADAERLFAQRPHSRGAARVALGLGDLYARFGDADGAQAEYARALELAAGADHNGLQITAAERLIGLVATASPHAAADLQARAPALRAEAFDASSTDGPPR